MGQVHCRSGTLEIDRRKAMTLVLHSPATPDQLAQMSEAFGETLIKLAVDVERGILAGGGELHADCEAALLECGDCWR